MAQAVLNNNALGFSANDGPGPQIYTTYVSEEIKIDFLRTRSGEIPDSELEIKLDPAKASALKGHCRFCKGDDHWSVNCPYKEVYNSVDDKTETTDDKAKQNAAGASGRYVTPHARGESRLPMGKFSKLFYLLIAGTTGDRRSDHFTCRVTNLPEDSETLDEDLRSMFSTVGRIDRFYLAREKTTGKPKGFAFITFTNRTDAEKAIERFNGSKLEHLILKVEWTKSEKEQV